MGPHIQSRKITISLDPEPAELPQGTNSRKPNIDTQFIIRQELAQNPHTQKQNYDANQSRKLSRIPIIKQTTILSQIHTRTAS